VSALAVVTELMAAHASSPAVRRVAIVGNAPLAPSEARAHAVDSADLVVRLTSMRSDAPGEIPTYGTRTDVAVVHRGVIASPDTFRDASRRLFLLAEPGRLHWEPEVQPWWWPTDLGLVPLPNHELTVPLGQLLGLPTETAVWATTGTLVTYLVLTAFPTAVVDLAGFTLVDAPEQTSFAHSWGDAVVVTPEHRLSAEAAQLRDWAATDRLHMLK
jgi:hypothetical protein